MSTTTSSERTKLGYGLRQEEGEDFWLFGALATIKISAEDTAGQYCVIDVEVPPGVGSPLHVHHDEDEWFFVHEGECEVYIGEAHLTLAAGGFAFAPKGVPHTFFGGPHGGKMVGREGGGKGEALTLAAGELAGILVLVGEVLEEGEQCLDAACDLGAARPLAIGTHTQAESDVV